MTKPIVLFLCTGNSVRSQIAEAFLRKLAGDRFDAHSAGSDPKGIHPLTVQVMNEVGLSLGDHHSKSLSDYLGKVSVRYVVFVCDRAEKSCPHLWPFALQTTCWPFDDPAEYEGTEQEKLGEFRRIRDQIEARIIQWLAEDVESL